MSLYLNHMQKKINFLASNLTMCVIMTTTLLPPQKLSAQPDSTDRQGHFSRSLLCPFTVSHPSQTH